jgi:hypothetical protein
MNFKILGKARHWWLVLVIPTTWEAEIGRIKVQDQFRLVVCKTLSPK